MPRTGRSDSGARVKWTVRSVTSTSGVDAMLIAAPPVEKLLREVTERLVLRRQGNERRKRLTADVLGARAHRGANGQPAAASRRQAAGQESDTAHRRCRRSDRH